MTRAKEASTSTDATETLVDESRDRAGETLDSSHVEPRVASAPDGSGSTWPGEKWDRYEFVRALGAGGMGEVFLAKDRRLGRTVALKFIRGADPKHCLRLLQEARAPSQIDR